jgi:hypothetical protein
MLVGLYLSMSAAADSFSQGYGHLGRESARLLQAFGCNIIAANSNGQRRLDDGVSRLPTVVLLTLPSSSFLVQAIRMVRSAMETFDRGLTGPASIPDAIYSTSDEASFNEFLSKSNILVASLPSTAGTRWLLDAEKLGTITIVFLCNNSHILQAACQRTQSLSMLAAETSSNQASIAGNTSNAAADEWQTRSSRPSKNQMVSSELRLT